MTMTLFNLRDLRGISIAWAIRNNLYRCNIFTEPFEGRCVRKCINNGERAKPYVLRNSLASATISRCYQLLQFF
jgi:hypothetical protein